MNNELSNRDDKLLLGVNVWLPYEIYWRILLELMQYHIDCFLNNFEKWADEIFSHNVDTLDEGKAEEKKDGEINDET